MSGVSSSSSRDTSPIELGPTLFNLNFPVRAVFPNAALGLQPVNGAGGARLSPYVVVTLLYLPADSHFVVVFLEMSVFYETTSLQPEELLSVFLDV